jgi:hypothetical protein
VKKLIENPYLHYGDMPDNIYDLRGDYSVGALQRDFKKLFTLTEEDISIDFLMNIWDTLLIGIPNGWENSSSRVLPVFKLQFSENLLLKKIPKELNDKKLLQGTRVLLKKDLRNYAISYRVYKKLTDRGYAIISDNTHFEPARGLWLKLAKNSDAQYRVILCDTEYGIIKDINGDTIYYDGTNYPLEQLWTSGSDYSGQYIVLVYF